MALSEKKSIFPVKNTSGQNINLNIFATKIGTRIFQLYMNNILVLWSLGLILPAAVVMLINLAYKKWPSNFLANTVVVSWIMIGVCQLIASIINGIYLHQPMQGFGSIVSFSVIGWLFGALAIAVGAAYDLSNSYVIRTYCRMGLYIIILALVSLIGKNLGIENLHLFPTPISLVLPDIPTVSFYTQTVLYQTEDTLGEKTVRLILFFPWATALGLAGLGITFVSCLDRNIVWKSIGVIGGCVAVIFSFSRIALASLLVTAMLLFFIRLNYMLKVLSALIFSLGFIVLLFSGFNPERMLENMEAEANSARAGSSQARELIYQKSWEGFLSSPIIGNGWIGPSVHKKETLPIGSHSTIYGLAYTGGSLTLASYCIAMTLTLFSLIYQALKHDITDNRRDIISVGIGLCVCLIMYSPYESLFNLTLSCLFLFTWIGACLSNNK